VPHQQEFHLHHGPSSHRSCRQDRNLDRSDRRHVYPQAADIIRDRIRCSYYSPGQDLPSMARMGKEFGISKLTMERPFTNCETRAGWS
jgi:DNA-binding transcriptional regulator YhcF (GntR family)